MADIQLSDSQIDALITMPKDLPADYRSRLRRMRSRSYSAQHEEAQIEISLTSDEAFRVVLRRNRISIGDFSAILGYVPRERSRVFRLRRYNGLHRHTNKLEGDSFRAFHIHYATERYQRAGWDEDGYAQSTERYSTLDSALEALLQDCNFVRPEQVSLQPRML